IGLAQAVGFVADMAHLRDLRAVVAGRADQRRLGRQRHGSRRLGIERSTAVAQNQVLAPCPALDREGPGFHARAAREPPRLEHARAFSRQSLGQSLQSRADVHFHDLREPVFDVAERDLADARAACKCLPNVKSAEGEEETVWTSTSPRTSRTTSTSWTGS